MKRTFNARVGDEVAQPRRSGWRKSGAIMLIVTVAAAAAQTPSYPPPVGAPQAQLQAAEQRKPSGGKFRRLFAGTLALLAQASGASTTADLTQVIAGGLANWFGRKSRANLDVPQAYPVFDPGTTAPYPVQPQAPVNAQAYDPNYYGFDATQSQGQYPAQYYDTITGTATAADSMYAYATTGAPGDDVLYAGLAYEVHLIAADGSSVPVNPAAHVFRTGDQFIVLYRPTLPGRMEVYNINPAGRQARIDALDIAAGQLARLGPYEFAAMRGEEQLRLILTPCATQSVPLLTRDIINVSQSNGSAADYATGYPAAMSAGSSFQLQSCSEYATRSAAPLRTRDIRKVAVEGNTGFALDPVAAQEQSSGDFAPRVLTIVFHHQ